MTLGVGQSLKPGCFVGFCFFKRHKAAEVHVVFLGLATPSSCLRSKLARHAPHGCHLVLSKGQGGPGPQACSSPETSRASLPQALLARLLTQAGGCEEPRGPGWRCSSHTLLKELQWGFQPDLPCPKGGPVKCLGATSSSCPLHPSSVSLGARPTSTCGSCSLLQPSGP